MNTFSLKIRRRKTSLIPSAVREELIEIASSNLSPETFDFFILSEPAKSTRYNIEVIIEVFVRDF